MLEIDPDYLAAGKYPLADLQRLKDAFLRLTIQQGGGKPIEGLRPPVHDAAGQLP